MKCPKCGYDLDKHKEDAEKIFSLMARGKKQEIEEEYVEDKVDPSDAYSILKKFAGKKKL